MEKKESNIFKITTPQENGELSLCNLKATRIQFYIFTKQINKIEFLSDKFEINNSQALRLILDFVDVNEVGEP